MEGWCTIPTAKRYSPGRGGGGTFMTIRGTGDRMEALEPLSFAGPFYLKTYPLWDYLLKKTHTL